MQPYILSLMILNGVISGIVGIALFLGLTCLIMSLIYFTDADDNASKAGWIAFNRKYWYVYAIVTVFTVIICAGNTASQILWLMAQGCTFVW